MLSIGWLGVCVSAKEQRLCRLHSPCSPFATLEIIMENALREREMWQGMFPLQLSAWAWAMSYDEKQQAHNK